MQPLVTVALSPSPPSPFLQNSASPRFRGLVHGITVVVKEEGIGGVYRGLVPTIAKQMGNQSIRFSVYTKLKEVRWRGG